MEFQEFGKIGRLSRDMVITEKIDGTNGQIGIGEHGEFFAGSRTRWLTLETGDNAGFLLWATLHRDELIAGLGPGRHYGEWWGVGIQRRYGLTEKRFSLFNTSRWTTPENDSRCLEVPCCHVVPVLYRGPFSTEAVATQIERLTTFGSSAAPGFMKPEGVVVYHVQANVYFKKTLDKDDEPKSREGGAK